MAEKTSNTKTTDKTVEKNEDAALEVVYVRDYRKKVFNTLTGEIFELDDETAERFATDPKFYDAVWDPNENKSVLVQFLKWEGADGQQVGS